MIYLFHGNDTEKLRTKIREFIDIAKSREPELSYTRITGDSFAESDFDELLGGQGLFVNKMLIFLDGVFEEKEIKDFFIKNLKALEESDNVFVVLFQGTGANLKKLTESATKSYEFSKKEKVQNKKNIFELGNAFAAGNRAKAWALFMEERSTGTPAESLAGLLHASVRRNISRNKVARQKSLAVINAYHNSRAQDGWALAESLEYLLLSS